MSSKLGTQFLFGVFVVVVGFVLFIHSFIYLFSWGPLYQTSMLGAVKSVVKWVGGRYFIRL